MYAIFIYMYAIYIYRSMFDGGSGFSRVKNMFWEPRWSLGAFSLAQGKQTWSNTRLGREEGGGEGFMNFLKRSITNLQLPSLKLK